MGCYSSVATELQTLHLSSYDFNEMKKYVSSTYTDEELLHYIQMIKQRRINITDPAKWHNLQMYINWINSIDTDDESSSNNRRIDNNSITDA